MQPVLGGGELLRAAILHPVLALEAEQQAQVQQLDQVDVVRGVLADAVQDRVKLFTAPRLTMEGG